MLSPQCVSPPVSPLSPHGALWDRAVCTGPLVSQPPTSLQAPPKVDTHQ